MAEFRDFFVNINIKLFNVRAGGQQFTNMEIVIEDKIKFRMFSYSCVIALILYNI